MIEWTESVRRKYGRNRVRKEGAREGGSNLVRTGFSGVENDLALPVAGPSKG